MTIYTNWGPQAYSNILDFLIKNKSETIKPIPMCLTYQFFSYIHDCFQMLKSLKINVFVPGWLCKKFWLLRCYESPKQLITLVKFQLLVTWCF